MTNEEGQHRIQRIPPTEKRGRVHTSSVTVAVLNSSTIYNGPELLQDDKHFRYEYFKASGNGGQHRNKTTSAVRCIHIPTGLKQERTARCQHANKKNATQAVREMLNDIVAQKTNTKRNDQRCDSLDNQRTRTYKFQKGIIVDHNNNTSISVKQFKKGELFKLWK